MRLPVVFVGSASETGSIVPAIQRNMEKDAYVLDWKNAFTVSHYTIQDLQERVQQADFAIFDLTAVGQRAERDSVTPAANQNVLFEIGLFMGVLGRDRTFLLVNEDAPPSLPSDLEGVTYEKYRPDASNMRNALGPACATFSARVREPTGIHEFRAVCESSDDLLMTSTMFWETAVSGSQRDEAFASRNIEVRSRLLPVP